MKIKIDKITSSTRNVGLKQEIELSDKILTKEGTVLIVKALGEKNVYDTVELVNGRMAKIIEGNIIAGVLGERKALRGFIGKIPSKLKVGDKIHILNLGGVFGICTSYNKSIGEPIQIEVLGTVINTKTGKPANIKDYAIDWATELPKSVPIIAVTGSCMNSGKTTAAVEVIKHLTKKGYKVAGAKVTGVSLMRDTLKMEDYGAVKSLNFTDAGLPSTMTPKDVIKATLGILSKLNSFSPDLIVVEFGDGILGGYCVDHLLRSTSIIQHVRAHIVAANDLVAAWGAQQLLLDYGIIPTIITGPATDNSIGVEFIESELRIPASNAVNNKEKLCRLVEKELYSNKWEINTTLGDLFK
ncbi:MAG: hypothetical protein ACTSUV_06415 [Candidatus Ranarchaeia archaeon]